MLTIRIYSNHLVTLFSHFSLDLMRESGMFAKLKGKWERRRDHISANNNQHMEVVRLDHVKMALGVLLCGILSSLVILGIETLIYKVRNMFIQSGAYERQSETNSGIKQGQDISNCCVTIHPTHRSLLRRAFR